MTFKRRPDEARAEMRDEIRMLGLDMIWYETRAAEAAEAKEFEVVARLDTQRQLARTLRSQLMRELWGH